MPLGRLLAHVFCSTDPGNNVLVPHSFAPLATATGETTCYFHATIAIGPSSRKLPSSNIKWPPSIRTPSHFRATNAITFSRRKNHSNNTKLRNTVRLTSAGSAIVHLAQGRGWRLTWTTSIRSKRAVPLVASNDFARFKQPSSIWRVVLVPTVEVRKMQEIKSIGASAHIWVRRLVCWQQVIIMMTNTS